MRHKVLLVLIVVLPLLGISAVITSLPALADEVAVTSPGVNDLDSQADRISFSLDTGDIALQPDGRLAVPGLDHYVSRPGAPQLPYFSTYVALPPEATVSVVVNGKQQQAIYAFEIKPVPDPESAFRAPLLGAEMPSVDESLLQNRPDPAFYQADHLFPESPYTVSEPMYLRDLRLVKLDLYPVRYNPVTGEIEQTPKMAVELYFEGAQSGGKAAPTPDDSYLKSAQELVLNYEQALAWRSLPTSRTLTNLPLPVGVDAYKIEVNEDGIYEVTYADLQAAGMNVGSVNPLTFQMLYRGEPVAYEFVGDGDTVFEAGEKVRFYGWAFDGSRLEKQFFVNNVFWLWAGGTAATIPSVSAQNNYPSAASWLSSVTWEPENIWFPTWTDEWDSFPNEPDAWYADEHYKFIVGPDTRQYTITLPYPAAAGPAALFTAEYSSKGSPAPGGFEVPHVVNIYLNGDPNFGTASWINEQNVNITNTVPLASLINGTNIFEAELATNAVVVPNTAVFLNRLTVDYERQFISDNDQLIFYDAVGGQRRFDVLEFSQNNPADVLVWDISNKTAPVAISNVSISGNGPYTYTFGTDHAAGSEFIATTVGNSLVPLTITQYVVADLEPVAGADWVAIAHHDFLAETAVLASHRSDDQYGGYQTHLVDIEDVVNQYGYGLPIPAAIRDYMVHALDTWPIPPAYLTLVGDATVNPRNNLHRGQPFSEPQYLLTDLVFEDRFNGQVPSDYTFSLLTGDDLLPDIAVGRFPVKTAADTAAIVNKIILYEQNQLNPAGWMENFLYVADNTDSGGNFCIENQHAGEHVPDHFNQIHLCLPDGATEVDAANMRTEIFSNTKNAGITVLNYRGHGAIRAWAATPIILDTSYVSSFENPQKPFVIITGDCLDGYFVYPTLQGLGETFLRANQKVSAAHWSSTGLGLSGEHSIVVDNLYLGLFEVGHTALGDAADYAKLVYAMSGAHQSILFSFILEGDPAMQFMRPDLDVQKSALSSQAAPGDTVDFVIQVTNDGIYPGHVTVIDTLPSEISFITATSSISATIQAAGDQITIDMQNGPDQLNGGLPWGTSAIVTLTAQVQIPAASGLKTNLALAEGTGLELNPANNVSTADIEILNIAPVAVDDDYEATEGVPLIVPEPGVLANDYDDNGHMLFTNLVSDPSHGTLVLNANGSFTYTPTLNYNGPDSFTYLASDGLAPSNVATVNLIISDTNSLPVANDNIYVSPSGYLSVPAPGVLGNDFDPDGDPLTASKESDPSHGTVVLNPDGSFTYTAEAGYIGVDSFTYRASDGRGGSDVATVYIIIETRLYLPVILLRPD